LRVNQGDENENVHKQALHHKLDALVQILPYNCSETQLQLLRGFTPSRTPPSTRMQVPLPSDPFSPHYFFAPPPWHPCSGA